MTRALISILGGAALCISSLTCATATPLAPGGAAGVKQAQTWERIPVWGYVGGVLVIIGFVAVITDTSKGSQGATTTCVTPNGASVAACTPSSPNSTGSTGSTGTN